MFSYVCTWVVCVSNLLRWAAVNSHVRSGTPWLWCECNEGFRCRSSPASRPSPSPRSYGKHTHIHSHTLISDLFYILNHLMRNGTTCKVVLKLILLSDGVCSLFIWPDAVFVSHSDAGVEGVELHDGGDSRVSVDEYLIIQTRNTCNSGNKSDRDRV